MSCEALGFFFQTHTKSAVEKAKKTRRVSQKLGGAFKARYALMMLKECYLASEFPPFWTNPPAGCFSESVSCWRISNLFLPREKKGRKFVSERRAFMLDRGAITFSSTERREEKEEEKGR